MCTEYHVHVYCDVYVFIQNSYKLDLDEDGYPIFVSDTDTSTASGSDTSSILSESHVHKLLNVIL